MPEHPPANPPPSFLRTHGWTLVWLASWAGLFVITHTRPPGVGKLPTGSDKVIHFLAYFALAMLGGRAAIGRGSRITTAWVITWTIIYAVYGAADELIQGFVGRDPSVADWGADLLGVGVAMAILLSYRNGAGRRSSERNEGQA